MSSASAKVKVSSTTTISQLKMLILVELEIPVFQQMLWCDELLLSDEDKTLKEYDILPGSSIIVHKVPEGALGFEQMDAAVLASVGGGGGKEEGFAGTSLQGCVKRDSDDKMSIDPVDGGVAGESVAQNGPVGSDEDSAGQVKKKMKVEEKTNDEHLAPNQWACEFCTFLNSNML
eukprot:TRINITY_DN15938_c0_g1_i1.p1 TRINITY_DN15938_c0_g1~~TRINITY_DN15938_c0_g1_i1.p1  ORF type:complete len:182 (-),score=72.17 TRINITY_DN15938_c0_g1_i1:38-562(-)